MLKSNINVRHYYMLTIFLLIVYVVFTAKHSISFGYLFPGAIIAFLLSTPSFFYKNPKQNTDKQKMGITDIFVPTKSKNRVARLSGGLMFYVLNILFWVAIINYILKV